MSDLEYSYIINIVLFIILMVFGNKDYQETDDEGTTITIRFWRVMSLIPILGTFPVILAMIFCDDLCGWKYFGRPAAPKKGFENATTKVYEVAIEEMIRLHPALALTSKNKNIRNRAEHILEQEKITS